MKKVGGFAWLDRSEWGVCYWLFFGGFSLGVREENGREEMTLRFWV